MKLFRRLTLVALAVLLGAVSANACQRRRLGHLVSTLKNDPDSANRWRAVLDLEDLLAREDNNGKALTPEIRPEDHRDLLAAIAEALTDDASPRVRSAAAHALGKIGSPLSLPALVGALGGESDGGVRSSIVAALGELKLPAVGEVLGRLLIECRRLESADSLASNAPFETVACSSIVRQLSKLDASVEPYVLPNLRHRSKWVRYKALEVLESIGPTARAIPAIRRLAADESFVVARVLACKLLGKRNKPPACERD